MARWAARLPNVYEHARWRGAGFCLRHPWASWRGPEIRAAAAVPLVLYALDREDRVDARLLERAEKIISVYDLHLPAEPTPAAWDAARETAGALFTAYRASKGTYRTLRNR